MCVINRGMHSYIKDLTAPSIPSFEWIRSMSNIIHYFYLLNWIRLAFKRSFILSISMSMETAIAAPVMFNSTICHGFVRRCANQKPLDSEDDCRWPCVVRYQFIHFLSWKLQGSNKLYTCCVQWACTCICEFYKWLNIKGMNIFIYL